jgi:MoaD family protein
MKIQVKLTSVLKDAVGKEKLEIEVGEAPTVREVFLRLKGEYPALDNELFDAEGQLEPHIFVAVNDAQVNRDGNLDRVLHERDVMTLMISFAGG